MIFYPKQLQSFTEKQKNNPYLPVVDNKNVYSFRSFSFFASLLLLFLTLFFCFFTTPSQARHRFNPPIRVVATADLYIVERGEYYVDEFVDVYNDDFIFPLTIVSVTLSAWRGNQTLLENENWTDFKKTIVIQPCSVVRVAHRKRLVGGTGYRSWLFRKSRFRVETNKGYVYSNVFTSPFKSDKPLPELISEFKKEAEKQSESMQKLPKNLDEIK